MCGIAGYTGFYEESLIKSMLDSMSHRGPDGLRFWCDPTVPISLGHVRLSIIDLSEQGAQPMWDSLGRFCIIYNGEIYNYRKLRSDLEAEGCKFRSNSDTEVLLTLFREKGPSCLKELRGIWAFGIWDSKERRLFLSRDPLGVKPLYFVVQRNKFLFSSEIKSFLCWSEFSKDVDKAAILETLIYLWTPGPRTMFAHVRKLLPGQNLTVYPGKAPVISSSSGIKPEANLKGMSENDAIELLQDQLYRSVQSQLVSDVPVGAFLSGGLDSSSVVAMAEQNGHRISRCYTIDYAGGRKWEGMVNDLDYARKVARHIGVECVEISLDNSVCNRVREMIWHLDEPQADLAPLNVLLISEAARKNGDYVLFSGAGGDDIFSGYRRHVALQNEHWWDWMPKPMRNGLPILTKVFPSSHPFGRRLQKLFGYADLSPDERLLRYFAWVSEKYVHALFQDDFCKELKNHDPFDVMRNALSSCTDGVDRLDKMLFLDMRYFLVDHNLNYTDKMGMACGIEIRVPLIDIDFVRLAWQIPSSFKLRKLTSKYIFKRAMEPFLPKDVIYRPKTGFVAPVREWLAGPLHEQVRDALSPKALKRRGWFSPASVQDLFDEHDKQKKDVQYLILALYTLEEWARMFIDGERPEGVVEY